MTKGKAQELIQVMKQLMKKGIYMLPRVGATDKLSYFLIGSKRGNRIAFFLPADLFQIVDSDFRIEGMKSKIVAFHRLCRSEMIDLFA